MAFVLNLGTLKFSAAQFKEVLCETDNIEAAARRCAKMVNRIITITLANSPTVSGILPDHPRWSYEMKWYGCSKPGDTHVAQLVNIQELLNARKET